MPLHLLWLVLFRVLALETTFWMVRILLTAYRKLLFCVFFYVGFCGGSLDRLKGVRCYCVHYITLQDWREIWNRKKSKTCSLSLKLTIRQKGAWICVCLISLFSGCTCEMCEAATLWNICLAHYAPSHPILFLTSLHSHATDEKCEKSFEVVSSSVSDVLQSTLYLWSSPLK